MVKPRVAVIGYGVAHYGALSPEVSYKEMMYDACTKAYQMAGIDPRKDVDSFISCSEDFNEGTSIFDEYVPDQMGGALRPVHTIAGDGIHGIAVAYMEILTEEFDVVVVEAHSKASNITNYPGLLHYACDPVFTRPLLAHPYFLAGLEMTGFLASTGNSLEQCALVSVKNKENALKNPLGVYCAKIELEDVIMSEPTFLPLTRLQESMLSDGGFCVVLASDEVARSLKVEPVWLTGIGWCNDSYQPEYRDFGEATSAIISGQIAYKKAGIKSPLNSIDFVELDDSFAYKELQHLEALGLAGVGESGALLEQGYFDPEGELPSNASGGSLGCGHFLDAGGLFRVIEVVKQLRGEAGSYQLKDARCGLAMSWRGIPTTSTAVAILEV